MVIFKLTNVYQHKLYPWYLFCGFEDKPSPSIFPNDKIPLRLIKAHFPQNLRRDHHISHLVSAHPLRSGVSSGPNYSRFLRLFSFTSSALYYIRIIQLHTFGMILQIPPSPFDPDSSP